jgi:hypothetical protein
MQAADSSRQCGIIIVRPNMSHRYCRNFKPHIDTLSYYPDLNPCKGMLTQIWLQTVNLTSAEWPLPARDPTFTSVLAVRFAPHAL